MRRILPTILLLILSVCTIAQAQPTQNSEVSPPLLYYPDKVETITDSVVLSAYLRLIAVANDELRRRGIVDRTRKEMNARHNFVGTKIKDATEPVTSAKQLSSLAKLLQAREIKDGGPAEYERAMIVMRHALSVCLTKLVDLHTAESDEEFLQLRKGWKKDGGFSLMMKSLEYRRIGSPKSGY